MKKTLIAALAALFAATDVVAASYTYTVRTDGKVAIVAYAKSTSGAVSVPSTVEGKPVVALQGAFNGCKKVTSITVPATVTEIGPNTFKNTSKLKSLTFANGSPGVYIGNDAFSGSKLKTLTIPAKSTVADYAFYGSKITTLEVMDPDPWANLSNIDDFLSPYNASGTKLMSEIKTLIVPNGSKSNYTDALLYQFLYGRKKKNRGTVREQYPRVFAVKAEGGEGSGYFKVDGKKVANGTPVKPGTKKVQFVASAAAGFAPQSLESKAGAGAWGPVGTGYLAVHTFTMPSYDIYYRAKFISFADEKAKVDKAASAILALGNTIKSVGEYFDLKLFKDETVTKTKVAAPGLPKGLAVGLQGDGYYHVAGAAQATLPSFSPSFVTITGASGYARVVPLPLQIGGDVMPQSAMMVDVGISQGYTDKVVGVLAGLSYPKAKKPVSLTASKKMSAKATGLPPGIKLQKVNSTSYTLAGRPTKAGAYVATVTMTIGGKKEVRRVAYEVHKNPLAGSYRGYVSSLALGCGAATMSVAADGKGTLSFTEGSKTTKVTAYPTVDSGFSWNPNFPSDGRFRYSFSVPKDKKRKLAKRTLKLAYYTDAASGVSGVARIRQGPLSGFSLSKSETLRLFPVYTAAELKKCTFYTSSTYRRDYGGFSLLIGSSDTQSDGEALWATADFDYDGGKVYLSGRLPAGKQFTATMPFVASYHADDTWGFTESASYRAVEVAPLAVKDSDGVVYVLKIPADPSEFKSNGDSKHETVGVFAWSRGGDGLFQWLTGAYKYNSRKSPYPASALRVFVDSGSSASPKLKLAFDPLPWSSAAQLFTSVNATSISVGGAAKSDYAFDQFTGLWTFEFSYGGLTYAFEGVPTMNNWTSPGHAFHGMVGYTSDGKNWTWGAAKVE